MHSNLNIKNDPAVRNFLQRMPKYVQDTFTDEQLIHLKLAIGARQWGQHQIDFRGVLSFFKYRYYVVFLTGRNRRELSAKERVASKWLQVWFVSILATLGLFFFIFVAYLIKSALGIDIFKGHSFGIWAWFKDLFS